MVKGINDRHPILNGTGFSMRQLNMMSKQQLLTIFDKNENGKISNIELSAKGVAADEISEHFKKVGIETEEEVQEDKKTVVKETEEGSSKAEDTAKAETVSQPKPVRKTRTIAGIKFYADEVKKIEYSTSSCLSGQETVIVTTPYGKFEYKLDIEEYNKEDHASILGPTIKNASLFSYEGTKKDDTIYLKNSYLPHIYIAGGGKDKIYFDKNSCAKDVSWWDHDDDDKIMFVDKKTGKYVAHENPYRCRY